MIIDDLGGVWDAAGLSGDAAEALRDCVSVWQANMARNVELDEYYTGKVPLRKVPTIVPASYRRDSVPCSWAEIAVQSVVERSQFDGFVVPGDDAAAARLAEISDSCSLGLGYQSALTGALVHGCAFASVVRDRRGPAIRWHSALDAAALWDWAADDVACGFAIVGRARRPGAPTGVPSFDTEPSKVDFYVPEGVWELTLDQASRGWSASWKPDGMGRPRLVALRYRPDGAHPLGRSRITEAMKGVIQEMMAVSLDLHVMAEFNAVGQKWVMGLSDAQAADVISRKWDYSADSIFVATDNPATEGTPVAGAFPQQSMEPLLSYKRSLATDFAAMASIPVSELLSQDSNPTSAEALAAAKDKLISLVEAVNLRSRRVLRDVGAMLLAVDSGTSLDRVPVAGLTAHFRDPSTPSAAALADSTLKIAQAIEGYGQTSVAQERLGFDEGERARLSGELRRIQARMGAAAILDRDREAMPREDDRPGAGQVPQGPAV